MTLTEFQTWLDNYLNFEKTQTKGIFWLESMKFLAEKLGNPQDSIPCIHVAGSKGKGSVSCMMANIIQASGKKCGVYTSPHITDFRERIGSAAGFFENSVYEEAADKLTACIDSIPLEELPGKRALTWFELVTLYAFVCFKTAGCDFVIYEVGLGGRLDSTNIVKPVLSVLMPIELEHTEFLGDTIEKIAGEKAGIIKQNIPCVAAPQNYDCADSVFRKTAAEKKSAITFVKDNIRTLEYSYNQGLMHLSFESKNCRINTNLKLIGDVQALNAATAVTAINLALPEITCENIEKGLSTAFLPGRFEINGSIVLDGAHTVKSISNTLSTLKKVFPHRKYHLLFACAGDKDIQDIVPLFKNQFESVTFTQPQTVRHCDADKTKEIADKNNINSFVNKDLISAYNNVKSILGKTDILLVTGSFYLVSEVKALLKN